MRAKEIPVQSLPDPSQAFNLNVASGALYSFRGNNGMPGDEYAEKLVGPYEVIGVGRHTITHQELVAYKACSGGALWFAPMYDFAIKMVPIPPEVGPKAEEKKAGKPTEAWRTGA